MTDIEIIQQPNQWRVSYSDDHSVRTLKHFDTLYAAYSFVWTALQKQGGK